MEHDNEFLCRHCRQRAAGAPHGTRHRNHCPACLWSLHVDRRPGDRRHDCHGAMEPIAVWVRRDGEWSLVHRCQQCGELRANRVAGDDSAVALISLAVRAIATPPFPLEHLSRLDGP